MASTGWLPRAPPPLFPSTAATPADPDTSAPARKAAPARPTDPAPVAGLDEDQMENAEAIVRAGRKMGVPRRGLVIAVATAMQESNLYNVASGVLPESRTTRTRALAGTTTRSGCSSSVRAAVGARWVG